MNRLSRIVVAATIATVAASPVAANAQWAVDLYKVSVATSVDHNGPADGCCSGLQTGWVNAVLNANNRPTLSAAGASYAGVNQINSVGSGGELAWWTVGGLGGAVAADGTTVIGSANFNTGGNWYAAGQSNNSTFQRSAIFTGFASNNGSAMWSLGADDDAWLFVNGQLKVDNGGVKGLGNTSSSLVTWSIGDRVEIFFSDRNTVDSGIQFDGGGLAISTVPEPSSYALMATGLIAVFGASRRRRKA